MSPKVGAASEVRLSIRLVYCGEQNTFYLVEMSICMPEINLFHLYFEKREKKNEEKRF